MYYNAPFKLSPCSSFRVIISTSHTSPNFPNRSRISFWDIVWLRPPTYSRFMLQRSSALGKKKTLLHLPMSPHRNGFIDLWWFIHLLIITGKFYVRTQFPDLSVTHLKEKIDILFFLINRSSSVASNDCFVLNLTWSWLRSLSYWCVFTLINGSLHYIQCHLSCPWV